MENFPVKNQGVINPVLNDQELFCLAIVNTLGRVPPESPAGVDPGVFGNWKSRHIPLHRADAENVPAGAGNQAGLSWISLVDVKESALEIVTGLGVGGVTPGGEKSQTARVVGVIGQKDLLKARPGLGPPPAEGHIDTEPDGGGVGDLGSQGGVHATAPVELAVVNRQIRCRGHGKRLSPLWIPQDVPVVPPLAVGRKVNGLGTRKFFKRHHKNRVELGMVENERIHHPLAVRLFCVELLEPRPA